MLALFENECLGVVAQPPRPVPGIVVGIGPLVPLTEIARSFEIADRACHIARQQRVAGVFGLPELTWRIAATDQPELSALLRERFLEPLSELGEFGAEIKAAVRSYLAHNRSVPRAARELCLHPNTVRYRLHRYAELTGADLDTTACLLDAAWAFELAELPERHDAL